MSLVKIHAGWWFGTFGFIFPYIGNVISSQQTNSIIFQRGRAQPPTRIGSKSVLSNLYLICNIARLDKVESTLWAFHRSQRSQPGRSLHWPSFWYTRKNISQSLSLAIFEWLRVDMYIHIHTQYIYIYYNDDPGLITPPYRSTRSTRSSEEVQKPNPSNNVNIHSSINDY